MLVRLAKKLQRLLLIRHPDANVARRELVAPDLLGR